MAAKKFFDPVPSTLVIGEEVDRGSFGVVYLATLDKKSVAVKRFHKALMTGVGSEENVPLKNFKTECERLKDLNHPNVVRYIGAYESEKGPLLVMELMYESLEKYLKRNKGCLSPERVLEICSSVCEGMAYLHGRDKPVIHRDLCSKNVLLTRKGVVKIADFGQSKLLQNIEQPLTTTQPGTVLYMPPEAVDSKTGYTAKMDSFSLGVLLLEICTQSGPSSGLKNIGGVIEVMRRDNDLTLLDDAHPHKPLIVWCLQHEKLRPAVAVIHNHVKNACEATIGKVNWTTKVKILEEEVKTQQNLEKEVEDLKEEVEARKQHEQGLRRQLEERLAKEVKSREELEEENLTFKQIIEQFQEDFSAERKDREGAADTFADREKEWMKQIRRAEEEGDHLRALYTQLQDQTNHQKHEEELILQQSADRKVLQDELLELTVPKLKERCKHLKMERLERELKDSEEMADWITKMFNQEASFKKQEADHHKQVHALHKQLEKLNKEVDKLKAELAKKKKDARGSKRIEEAYGRLYDEKKDLECKLITAQEAKRIASQHIAELMQENRTLKVEIEGTRQRLLQELQGVQTQYRVLSSQTITLREENEKLKQKMLTSQYQQQVYHHPIPAEESFHQSLPRMPSGPGQVVHQGTVLLQLGPSYQQQQQQQRRQPLPRAHSTPEHQESDVSSENILPSPMTSRPRQHSMTYDSDTSFQPNQRYIGDGINRENRHEAHQYKKAVEQGVPAPDDVDESIWPSSRQDVETNVQELEKHPSRDGITNEIKVKAEWLKRNPQDKVYAVPDDIDESIWPFDPNLECPHCGKRFRRGQILEYRYHLDDEHAP